jgi:hypothetical protein
MRHLPRRRILRSNPNVLRILGDRTTKYRIAASLTSGSSRLVQRCSGKLALAIPNDDRAHECIPCWMHQSSLVVSAIRVYCLVLFIILQVVGQLYMYIDPCRTDMYDGIFNHTRFYFLAISSRTIPPVPDRSSGRAIAGSLHTNEKERHFRIGTLRPDATSRPPRPERAT